MQLVNEIKSLNISPFIDKNEKLINKTIFFNVIYHSIFLIFSQILSLNAIIKHFGLNFDGNVLLESISIL